MNKYDYLSVLSGERKVDYHGNIYEIIETNYYGVILQSVNDDSYVSITYRELRLNAEVV